MKLSKFNHYYSTEKTRYVYNAFSNALCEVDDECLDMLKMQKFDVDCDEIKDLKECGFIICDEVDELGIIAENMYRDRMNTDALMLTIAPTLGCNFRCPYCYENDVIKKTTITETVEDAIIEFVKTRIKTISVLGITWYGGEPLLKIDSIERLSKKLLSLCGEYSVDYSAGITTNGFYLDEDVYKKLAEFKVTNIQIPLDGIKENHDKSRFLATGEGSYDKIIANLCRLKSIMEKDKNLSFPGITIRVNITHKNERDIDSIMSQLIDLGLTEYIGIYPAQVTVDEDNGLALSNSEFLELRKNFEEGYHEASGKEAMMMYYPKRINACCGCDKVNAYVIDPEGKLYKCWEEIGKQEAVVGDVFVGEYEIKPTRYYKNFLYNPTQDDKCNKCDILPVCMGGACPIVREKKGRYSCEENRRLFDLNIQHSLTALGEKEIVEIFL